MLIIVELNIEVIILPRFDNEGFNPKKRINNDDRDRAVPDEENYYSNVPVDLNFNNRQAGSGDVVDNQSRNNYVDINSYINDNSDNLNGYGDDLQPPLRSQRQRYGDNQGDMLNGFERAGRQKAPPKRSNQGSAKSNSKPPKKKKKGKLKKGKTILISIIAILLAIIVIAVSLVNGVLGKIKYDEPKENEYIAASQLKSDPLVKNILLLGVDARKNEESNESRSDSMMLISVDMKHHCIKMVSFLRDTWVYIPVRDKEQRLNAACQYGGYQGVVDTIEYNFGIDIDGYVIADFEMFKVLVDSIGGVEVEVTKKEAKEVTKHKKRYGNVKLEAGKHKLTGEQALAYCRIRKIDTDFVRTKRQRTVMTSIIKGMKDANLFTLYKMAANSAPYIETDLTKSQLKRIALRAGYCMTGDMFQQKVPFEGTWKYANIRGNSVISIDLDDNKEKLIDYIYNKTADELKAEEKEDK